MKLFKWQRFLLFPLLLLPTFFVVAQEVDYLKIIPPAGTTTDFAEKLVRLSWVNYPGNKAVEANIDIAEQELVIARWSWLNRITVSGNLNEFTLTGGGPSEIGGRAILYPRYNIGITLSPGMIFQLPAETKRAKESLNIAQYNVNEQKLLVRKAVLQRYQEYLMHKQILEMESNMLESVKTEFQIKEDRFKKGHVMLVDYNESASLYMAQQRQKLQAETNYISAKLELESLIGMRLEDVR